jgi:hypothetical protein
VPPPTLSVPTRCKRASAATTLGVGTTGPSSPTVALQTPQSREQPASPGRHKAPTESHPHSSHSPDSTGTFAGTRTRKAAGRGATPTPSVTGIRAVCARGTLRRPPPASSRRPFASRSTRLRVSSPTLRAHRRAGRPTGCALGGTLSASATASRPRRLRRRRTGSVARSPCAKTISLWRLLRQPPPTGSAPTCACRAGRRSTKLLRRLPRRIARAWPSPPARPASARPAVQQLQQTASA